MNLVAKLAATAAVAASLAAPAAAQDRAGWPSTIIIGTGSQGGAYFTYGSGFATMIGEALGVNASVEITGGPVQNVTLVQTGDHNMGFVTMGPAYEAFVGKSELMPGVEHKDIRALFPMYQTPLQAAALSSSGIRSLADLNGKRVGVGPAGGTAATYWPRYLDAAGLKATISNAGANDSAGQLKDGLIDAFLFAAGIPTGAFSQLAVENDVVFLSMSEAERQLFLKAEPALSPFTIPAKTYEDQPEAVESVSLWNFAIAGKGMPDTLAYELTKLAMTNYERMKQNHAAAKETRPEAYKFNSFMRFHPGAVRWFEENGYKIADNLK
ncbi:MAG: TAXI family TRAP transporter solute-binding subunit [Thalassobaculum sp.]|uniref:TAXI family TRAP transporter solute-binding subunit n=1 Tax=Thalassobaculum sp. TaxID=2022740 RepID=UPI0032ED1E72